MAGAEKSERRITRSEQLEYRNGYGKPRRFSTNLETIEIHRPRVGDWERFKSRLLPLFKRQGREIRDLMPELYLHGLASGDFELALRGSIRRRGAALGLVIMRLKRSGRRI